MESFIDAKTLKKKQVGQLLSWPSSYIDHSPTFPTSVVESRKIPFLALEVIHYWAHTVQHVQTDVENLATVTASDTLHVQNSHI